MPHRLPVRGGDLAAAQVEDVEPLAGGGAFLANRLALAARECGEEAVKFGIIEVVPMILQTKSLDPAARRRRRDFTGSAEGDVRRR